MQYDHCERMGQRKCRCRGGGGGGGVVWMVMIQASGVLTGHWQRVDSVQYQGARFW